MWRKNSAARSNSIGVRRISVPATSTMSNGDNRLNSCQSRLRGTTGRLRWRRKNSSMKYISSKVDGSGSTASSGPACNSDNPRICRLRALMINGVW
ncbi:hypothetical protein D9M68_476490 [compost metagenome]